MYCFPPLCFVTAERMICSLSKIATESNKWALTWQNQHNGCRPRKDSDLLGHLPSLIWVFAIRMKKAWVLSYSLRAQQRLWSAADWSLRWAHSHIVGFVMRRLKFQSQLPNFFDPPSKHTKSFPAIAWSFGFSKIILNANFLTIKNIKEHETSSIKQLNQYQEAIAFNRRS